MASLLDHRIRRLDVSGRGTRWARLGASRDVLRWHVGLDHVEYLNVQHDGGKANGEDAFSFAAKGGRALDDNPLWRVVSGSELRWRPGSTLKIGVDDAAGNAVFRWCYVEEDAETCDAPEVFNR